VTGTAAPATGVAARIAPAPRRPDSSRMREPLLVLEVQTPEDCVGNVIGELASRRGVVEELVAMAGNQTAVTATVPVAEIRGFDLSLARLTRGAGRHRTIGTRP